MRILYVEDNEVNRALVERVVRARKFSVVFHDEGEDALKTLENDPTIDLILMDIELAGAISGLDVIRTMRARNDKRPVVAVTAYAMMGDRERILEAGCDQYLPKPLVITELLNMLDHYSAVLAAKAAEPVPAAAAVTPPPPEAPAGPAAGETTTAAVVPLAAEVPQPAAEAPAPAAEAAPAPGVSEPTSPTAPPAAPPVQAAPVAAVPAAATEAAVPGQESGFMSEPTLPTAPTAPTAPPVPTPPDTAAPAPAPPAPSPVPVTEAPVKPAAAKKNAALVIDDEPANRDFLIRLLQQAKLEVRGASTAAEALQIADSTAEFALVVIDNKLPDMDGVDLLAKLRPRYPEARMVMATMLDERQLMAKAFENGCDVFLVKPHGFMELFRRLQTPDKPGEDRLRRLIIDQYGPRPFRG